MLTRLCSAATATYELGKHDDSIEWCDRGLRVEHSNTDIITLRQKAVKGKAARDKTLRMEAARQRKEDQAKQALSAAIRVGIRCLARWQILMRRSHYQSRFRLVGFKRPVDGRRNGGARRRVETCLRKWKM